MAKDVDLFTREIAQDRLVSLRTNDAPLWIDPVLNESAQCLSRAKQPRLFATKEQEAYGWVGSDIENDPLDAQVCGLHLPSNGYPWHCSKGLEQLIAGEGTNCYGGSRVSYLVRA